VVAGTHRPHGAVVREILFAIQNPIRSKHFSGGWVNPSIRLVPARRGTTKVGAVDANGRLGYVQNVGSAPAAATANETHPYGVGAFLLAGEQIIKL